MADRVVPWWYYLILILAFALLGQNAEAQNKGGTLFASATYTSTQTSVDVINPTGRGALVFIRISSYTSGNWTPSIQGKDPASSQYYTILTGTPLSTTGLTVLRVYPGVTTSAAVAVSEPIPIAWRVVLTGASTPSSQFSVGYVQLQ